MSASPDLMRRRRRTAVSQQPADGIDAPDAASDRSWVTPLTGLLGGDDTAVVAGSGTSERAQLRRRAAPAGEIDEARRRGVAGGATTLPFRDRIQAAFGRHSLDGVRAHTDHAAGVAAVGLDARAFTAGDDVVFGARPDLATAAHEAAHVVQQRQGVAMSGAVGASGDRYEQRAHAVADAVVHGRSAEELLGEPAGAATPAASSPVQLLTDEDIDKLREYIDEQIDQIELGYLAKSVIDLKIAEIKKLGLADGKKGLEKARPLIDTWLTDVKKAKTPAPKSPVDDGASDKSSKTPEPSSSSSGPTPAPTAKKSGRKKFVKFDPDQFASSSTPAPKMAYSSAATKSASKPQPKPTVDPDAISPKSQGVVDKFQAWAPSKGHDGCKATDLKATELDAAVNKIDLKNYYIKLGAGTGEWKTKNQLKLIHFAVDDKPSGKKATFHITISDSAYATLKAQYGEEDA